MEYKLESILLTVFDELFVDLNEVEEYEDYYLIYNPLVHDKKSKSAAVFKEDGALKMFNSSLNINGEEKTILTLTQWLRLTNMLKYYIKIICIQNYIDENEFLDYQYDLKNFLLFSEINILSKNRFTYLRKKFYSNFIIDKDIFNINDSKIEIKEKFKTKTIKKLDSKIEYLKPNEKEMETIEKYKQQRKIPNLPNVKPVKMVINDIYVKLGICFCYNNDFKKIRIINENKYRYFSSGKYDELYEVRKNNSDTCYIVEGEINAISLLNIIDDDIYALHNVNSIPSSLYQIEKYRKIVIKVDLDKYTAVKKLFIEKIKNVLKNSEVVIDFAVKDINEDFNSLLIKGELSKEMVCEQNDKSGQI